MNKLVFLVVIALILCNSCGKAPLNWELEGMWKLNCAELKDGSILTSQDSLYMSFQRDVIQLRKSSPTNHSVVTVLGYFVFTGDSLHIDMKLELQDLHYWGFNDVKQSFIVNKFKSKKLEIENSGGCWYFSKF